MIQKYCLAISAWQSCSVVVAGRISLWDLLGVWNAGCNAIPSGLAEGCIARPRMHEIPFNTGNGQDLSFISGKVKHMPLWPRTVALGTTCISPEAWRNKISRGIWTSTLFCNSLCKGVASCER